MVNEEYRRKDWKAISQKAAWVLINLERLTQRKLNSKTWHILLLISQLALWFPPRFLHSPAKTSNYLEPDAVQTVMEIPKHSFSEPWTNIIIQEWAYAERHGKIQMLLYWRSNGFEVLQLILRKLLHSKNAVICNGDTAAHKTSITLSSSLYACTKSAGCKDDIHFSECRTVPSKKSNNKSKFGVFF